VLPFTGLNSPTGVAVDSAGTLYVTDTGDSRVVKLAAGATTQTVLPFSPSPTSSGSSADVGSFYGLFPYGVAVDGAGNLYVTDFEKEATWKGNFNPDLGRVVKLPAGSDTQAVLPFTGLYNPAGVAVDSAGTLYVTDTGNSRVVKLAAGATTQTVLPFTGLGGPTGVAVDGAGNLYVTDGGGNERVVKLAAASSTQSVLPFTGLKNNPTGVAVDSAGNLYVTVGIINQVVKLAAGSTTPTVLPFTGLNDPVGVAVDAAGNLYVTDSGNNRVVKLPAG
jgi:serine/threonine-protein kinase